MIRKPVFILIIQNPSSLLQVTEVEDRVFEPGSELHLALNLLEDKNMKWMKFVSEVHTCTLPSILLITLKVLTYRYLKHGFIQGCYHLKTE